MSVKLVSPSGHLEAEGFSQGNWTCDLLIYPEGFFASLYLALFSKLKFKCTARLCHYKPIFIAI